MISNRRHWLKKIGIGVAGIGLANFNSFASPVEQVCIITPNKDPVNRIGITTPTL